MPEYPFELQVFLKIWLFSESCTVIPAFKLELQELLLIVLYDESLKEIECQ